MFINSFISMFQNTINDNRLDKVDSNLVRYFRNEYGSEWKTALENHLYSKESKNDKKVA